MNQFYTPKSKTERYIFYFCALFQIIFLVNSYLKNDSVGELLWMCNVGSFLFGLGCLSMHRKLIQTSAFWLIAGLVVWLLETIMNPQNPDVGAWASHLTHFSDALMAGYVLYKVRIDKNIWAYAFVLFFLVHYLCVWLTAPEYNVNASHKIWEGWDFFSAYWQYFIFQCIAAVLSMGLFNLILWLLIPAQKHAQ